MAPFISPMLASTLLGSVFPFMEKRFITRVRYSGQKKKSSQHQIVNSTCTSRFSLSDLNRVHADHILLSL